MTDPVAARTHVAAHTDTTLALSRDRGMELAVHTGVGIAVIILIAGLVVGGAL